MFDDLYYIYHSLSSYILRLNLQLRNKEPGMVACSRSEHGSIIVENLNKNGQMLVEVLCSMHRSLTFVKGLILYWEKEKEKGKKKTTEQNIYAC